MTESEFDNYVGDYAGEECKIESIEVDVDPMKFEDNYYNIRFNDGHKLNGVSGVHLDIID